MENPLFYLAWMAVFFGLVAPLFVRHGFYARLLDQRARQPGYEPLLDGVRGIAALSVFVQHSIITFRYASSGRWERPPGELYQHLGPSSVLVFFFLTGYLFWSKLDHGRKPLSLRSFFLARYKRLMPAYLTTALVVVCITILERGGVQVPVTRLLKSVGYWATCFLGFPDINGYPLTQLMLMAGVAWTLQMEWLFYFALPVLSVFAKGHRVFLLLAGGVALDLLFQYHWLDGSSSQIRVILSLFCRFFAHGFGIGILIAHFNGNERLRAWARHRWTPVLCLAVLVILVRNVSGNTSWMQSCLLGLVFGSIAWGNSFWGLLRSRAAVLLGTVSYSVYLLHGLVLFTFREAVLKRVHLDVPAFWCCIGILGAMVITLASLMYRFVEHPFLRSAGGRSTAIPQHAANVEPAIGDSQPPNELRQAA